MGPYDENNHHTYEKELIDEVCKYITYIWKKAGTLEEVFIAVDGVVPMAKMKQQRLRRFKSIVNERYEIIQGVKDINKKSWDRNSITPGTIFMKKLHTGLQELCARHTSWSVSGYDEPGEGEHKIMAYIRSQSKTINNMTYIVYGLDADLILLSILHSETCKQNIYLMREDMEFNSVVKDDNDKEEMSFLNINVLKNVLFKNPSKEHIQDYIMMMSLLGNDFLPHSISLTIKNGGHQILIAVLRKFNRENTFLVDENGKIIWEHLKLYIKEFMNQETSLFQDFCKKKQQTTTIKGRSEYEIKMAPVNILPCIWFVEKELYENNSMKKDWEETYYKLFVNKTESLKEYVKGLQWIMDYYLGNPIEVDWYYPYMYTALWKDLYNYLTNTKISITYILEPYIEPEQQLALVLPVQSYGLLQNPKYKEFPTLYPDLYPSEFGFHSLGKKMFYECESNIPTFSTRFLRNII